MFDDIPEDNREGYPCQKCHNGSVEKNMTGTKWVCDECDFEVDVKKPEEL
jgi:ribosomal protein L37AE/L43A